MKAWQAVTNLDKTKQALVLILASDKKGEFLENLALNDLKQETGVDTFLAYLKTNYGKDELIDVLDRYKSFRDYQRVTGQSIGDYCAGFEQRVNRIKSKGVTLPPEVLAFELIRNARITSEEEKLVMTGLDFTKKPTMYTSAVSSLKKFLGEGCSAIKSFDASAIKCEPTYASWNGGFRGRGSNRYQGNRGYGGNRGFRAGFRGGNRGSGKGPNEDNPVGRDGLPLKCHICGSYKHFANICPHKTNKVHMMEDVEENKEHGSEDLLLNKTYMCDIILYTGYDKDRVNRLCHETVGCAILDSACASTVAGEAWMDDFIANRIPESEKGNLKKRKGEKLFRFGDGPVMKSSYQVDLPVTIAEMNVILTVDVVEAHIPLLLSKSQMKKFGMTIDLANDRAIFMGKKIWLNEAESGHYTIPLTNSDIVKEILLVDLEHVAGSELKKTLFKLHCQLGHPREENLKSLIVNAGLWKDSFQESFDKMYENCQICKKYKKTPPRPKVAMPFANEFNEAVCADLKSWKTGWILHLIDMHTRYTRSVPVTRKKATEILDRILKDWVAIFGVMRKLLTDNGGEFTAEETREVASHLNVVKYTTAAEAPWQNGLCEKVHQVTDMILLKLSAEYPHTSLDVLLAWANMARNSLNMYNGFSSHQLVFGVNPNLPCVMNAGAPGLNESTSSEVFAKHLNSLQSSREAYIKTENAERIKRALRHKIRTSQQIFHHGEKVYYKRDKAERWLGPGKVMFQDGKIVFVRHGNVYVRVSVNRLITAGNEEWLEDDDKEPVVEPTKGNENVPEPVADDKEPVPEPEADDKEPVPELEADDIEPVPEPEPKHDAIMNKVEQIIDEERSARETISESPSGIQTRSKTREAGEVCSICKKVVKGEDPAVKCDICLAWCHIECAGVSQEDYVKLLEMEHSFEWECPGNHEPEFQEVYATYVPTSQYQEPESKNAMSEELKKLQEYEVCEEVDYEGQDCISTKWVITVKNGKRKARLVCRGYEEQALVRRDSPTVAKAGIRVLLMTSATKRWRVRSTDIKSAFLQGNELERDVFIKPPKEAGLKGKIWKLKKCLYGLNDASRKFYLSIKEVLCLNGCVQSAGDPSFYYMKEADDLAGVIISHVDDFLHAGNAFFEEQVIKPLKEKFSAGSEDEIDFSYCGYQIAQSETSISLHQIPYVSSLEVVAWSPEALKDKKRDLTDLEQTDYRSLVGSLNWCVQGSHPDLVFDLVELSMKLKNAKVEDYIRATKAVKRLKSTEVYVLFPDLTDMKDLEIIVFSDASFNNLEGSGSAGAYVILGRNKETSRCCPLTWKGNKVKRVVRSTLAAEALSLSSALENAFYIKTFISETLSVEPGIRAYVDNKGLVDNIHSTKLVEDTRLNLDLSIIKQMLQKGEVESVEWVSKAGQLADSMTKKGVSGDKLRACLTDGYLNL